MTELIGFQTMAILDPYGMTFDALGVFGLAFHLLFKSWSTYCVMKYLLFTLWSVSSNRFFATTLGNDIYPTLKFIHQFLHPSFIFL